MLVTFWDPTLSQYIVEKAVFTSYPGPPCKKPYLVVRRKIFSMSDAKRHGIAIIAPPVDRHQLNLYKQWEQQ